MQFTVTSHHPSGNKYAHVHDSLTVALEDMRILGNMGVRFTVSFVPEPPKVFEIGAKARILPAFGREIPDRANWVGRTVTLVTHHKDPIFSDSDWSAILDDGTYDGSYAFKESELELI